MGQGFPRKLLSYHIELIEKKYNIQRGDQTTQLEEKLVSEDVVLEYQKKTP